MSRTASATYEIEEAPLADKRRHVVKLTVAPTYRGAKQWSDQEQNFTPLENEIEITIDPSEFLEFIPLRDIAEQAKDGDFFACYSDDDTAAVATIICQLDAIDLLDVEAVLDNVRDFLKQGRTDDALLLLDRWQHPIFKSAEAAEATVKRILPHA
jgi:hypothetical protein